MGLTQAFSPIAGALDEESRSSIGVAERNTILKSDGLLLREFKNGNYGYKVEDDHLYITSFRAANEKNGDTIAIFAPGIWGSVETAE